MLLEKINTIAQKGETVVDCCVLCVCVWLVGYGWILSILRSGAMDRGKPHDSPHCDSRRYEQCLSATAHHLPEIVSVHLMNKAVVVVVLPE